MPSDSARRIHWRSSLRRGELIVGEVDDADDAEVEVLLRTRCSPSGGAGPAARDDFEQRVCWAASEVVGHLEHGLRVALRTDCEWIEAGSGAAHRGRLLSFLALVQPRSSEAEPSVDLNTDRECAG